MFKTYEDIPTGTEFLLRRDSDKSDWDMDLTEDDYKYVYVYSEFIAMCDNPIIMSVKNIDYNRAWHMDLEFLNTHFKKKIISLKQILGESK